MSPNLLLTVAVSPMPYLQDVIVLFAAALTVIVVSYRLKMGPVMGFLMTGMLVGPYGAAWIRDTHHVEVFAELGVIFLLFGIGLELSFDRLRKLARYLLIGGGLQVGLTVAATLGIALAVQPSFRVALLLGLIVSLSSTAIVLKRYQELRELESPHGQIATGILIFQDFLIVPFLLMVPILAGSAASGGMAVARQFGVGLLVVGGVFALGRVLMPYVLKVLVHTAIRELFVIASLLACLGGALITEKLGFSLALGAFLAGVLLSESEYHHQVIAETGPFRDVFNSIFFISVGMLVDLPFAARHLGWVLAVALGVFLLKGTFVFLAAWVSKLTLRTRWLAALALAQVGELSFLLSLSGHQHGLLSDDLYQMILAVAVLTMLATPAAMAVGPRLVDRWLTRSTSQAVETADPTRRRHVVVVGYGLNGQHLVRVLEAASAPYVVIEADGYRVRKAKERGKEMLFGDATRPEILRRADIETAAVVVVAISDHDAAATTVRGARQLNPTVHIVARSRRLSEIEHLREVGADEVVAEEFETSMEILTAVLHRLHVPGNVIRSQSRLLRADGYQMLRSPPPSGGLAEPLRRALAVGTTDSFLLAPHHHAVGRSLRTLDLRNRTGVTVLAVLRNDQPITSPSSDLEFRTHDVLILVGGHAEIEAAFRVLEESA